jgi:SAM-dependent methyltransferase
MQDDGFFNATVAATYDRDHGGADPAQAVDVLREFAGHGSALEFAIGTGRMALHLAASGIGVKGIELSAAMVTELRKKPGGDKIEVTIGDMTTARVDGAFSLVFLVFNTIDNLTTQNAQIACFQNAAAHLSPGGRFVVETQMPGILRLPFGETRLAFAAGPDHWGTDIYDPVTQTYTSNHIWLKDGTATHLTIPFRYAWPAELDLMARLAGLQLEYRWADWDRTPFTHHSTKHVSVWKKPTT